MFEFNIGTRPRKKQKKKEKKEKTDVKTSKKVWSQSVMKKSDILVEKDKTASGGKTSIVESKKDNPPGRKGSLKCLTKDIMQRSNQTVECTLKNKRAGCVS